MAKAIQKTNVMRVLDQKKVPYEMYTYADTEAISGVEVAAVLGVEAAEVIEQVAFVHCLGDCEKKTFKHEYQGIETCAAAKTLYGGEADCTYGCLGYGDCAKVCPVDAICIENGIAHVDPRKCIGCGLCAKTCPNNVISLIDDIEKAVITCNNKEKGAVARKKCSNACIKCKKCENEFSDQYSNVIRCSSKQISEFVNWIKQQDFYKNTTIIIAETIPAMLMLFLFLVL